MSQHNKRHYRSNFRICGQNWLFLAYYWQNLGPEDYHKCHKQITTHTFISVSIIYDLRESLGFQQHNGKGTKDGFSKFRGAKLATFCLFLTNFGPYSHISLQNRSKSMLVCQFQSYTALDSHWGCLQHNLKGSRDVFSGFWG